jgi:hypothetical protein
MHTRAHTHTHTRTHTYASVLGDWLPFVAANPTRYIALGRVLPFHLSFAQ